MRTSIGTYWKIIVNNIPIGKWTSLHELYEIIEKNTIFYQEDLFPVDKNKNDTVWRRNLRNTLQYYKSNGKILWDGNGNYKIDRPYIWRMIKDAICNLSGEVSQKQIIDYITKRWPNVNEGTISAQIAVLTVNHESRGHYPENKKARITNTGSVYDYLFKTSRGVFCKYDPTIHGIWEIYSHSNKMLVREIIKQAPKVFGPSDIVYIKSVNNKLLGEAYLNELDTFILHFPSKHKSNIPSCAIGEIILIYQKINNIKTFSHLVTPVDDIIYEEKTRTNYPYGRKVKTLAICQKNNYIAVSDTLWKSIKLSGVTNGNSCKIENIKNIVDLESIKFDTWKKFEPFFIKSEDYSFVKTYEITNEINNYNYDVSVSEGSAQLVTHLVRERNSKIVNEKKIAALNNGTLFCQVCLFSFITTYNKAFIECHHIIPISQTGARSTKIEDLALVCSNCHRMLHSKFDGKFLSIEELKNHIKLLT